MFTDPDCRPREGWLAALVGVLDDGADVALGPTSFQRGAGWRARGVHRAKYAMWCSSAAPTNEVTAIPSSNLALTQAGWTRIGGFCSDRWHADTLLGWRAAELGLEVAFVPGAVVEHVAEPDLRRFVREREERGRTFAAMRATRAGWSRPVALARALSETFVPVVLLVRSLRHAARGDELADALRTAPILLLGFGAWALGEARALAPPAVVSRRLFAGLALALLALTPPLNAATDGGAMLDVALSFVYDGNLDVTCAHKTFDARRWAAASRRSTCWSPSRSCRSWRSAG